MNKLVTVIDLSSNRIAAAAAVMSKAGGVSLLGLEHLDSRGVREGDIIDLNKATEDIASVKNKLERRKNIKIKNIFVATKGADTKMDILRGMIPLARTPREITTRDLLKCLEVTAMIKLPLERAIIEKIVRNFRIDGAPGDIQNPVGLYGIRLEAEAFIATINQSKVQSITKCIDHAGLLLDGIHLSAIACSNSVLDEKEKKEGVLLLDIGDGLTEALTFKNNMLKNFRVIKKKGEAVLNGSIRPDKNGFSSVVVTGKGALLESAIEKAEKIFKRPARIGILRKGGGSLGLRYSSQNAITHTRTIGLIRHLAREHKNNHIHKSPIHKAFRKISDLYETYF
jgi:cell division ATPase FtsA